jgi:IS1 family transposase
MNRLSRAERARIIGCLTEGMSIRATSRLTGAAQNTILKLLSDLGAACSEYQDRVLRDLPCQRVEADEIWSFVRAKARNVPEAHKDEWGWGDVWTWTAIDADSKLMISWLVGTRDADAAREFMTDVASRLRSRVQLTTDGHKAYLMAVEAAFGSEIDYAQLVKIYGAPASQDESPTARRYSPVECTGIDINVVTGDPDPEHISTSYVERSNLTLRMGNRRFTRLTNAFSKRVENHAASVSLFMFHYNFGRTHRSLRNPYPRTPAMAAGVTDHIWTLEEIASLLEQSKVPARAPVLGGD